MGSGSERLNRLSMPGVVSVDVGILDLCGNGMAAERFRSMPGGRDHPDLGLI